MLYEVITGLQGAHHGRRVRGAQDEPRPHQCGGGGGPRGARLPLPAGQRHPPAGAGAAGEPGVSTTGPDHGAGLTRPSDTTEDATEGEDRGIAPGACRITSYNVCYTKLLRACSKRSLA